MGLVAMMPGGGAVFAVALAFALPVLPGPQMAVARAQAGAVTGVPATCERNEFEGVVDSAAQTLRELTGKFTPVFQGKLRALKDKRGWDYDQFLKEAARFVRDEQITEFDEKSSQLLAEINSTGDGGGAKPDCVLLVKLRSSMQALVETQNAKWSYMFRQIDAELAK